MSRIAPTPARLVLAAVFALGLAGCDRPAESEAASAQPATLAPAETRFPIALDGKTIPMRLRLTELELSTGLMNTPVLAEGEGMLFVQRDQARRAFWMKNVPYDIDIAHFDPNGVLLEHFRLHALDTTAVSTQADNIRYSLELPAGHLERHGIRPGARLDLAAVAAAVDARGFRSRDFVNAAPRE